MRNCVNTICSDRWVWLNFRFTTAQMQTRWRLLIGKASASDGLPVKAGSVG